MHNLDVSVVRLDNVLRNEAGHTTCLRCGHDIFTSMGTDPDKEMLLTECHKCGALYKFYVDEIKQLKEVSH
jgi:transcription elongation factor Elf1